MTSACLRLLGSPEFFNIEPQKKVRFAYAKLVLLLAYLALEHKAHTRESLADLFWPELSANDARANLRRALFNLQKIFIHAGLPKSLIHADRTLVQLSRECIWIDVLEFEKAERQDNTSIIYKHLELYKGAFLDGIFPAEEELASWVQNRRRQYEQKAVTLFERVIALTLAAEDFNSLEQGCRQLIAIDSVNELAHSSLIRMYIDSGNQIAARKIYEAYGKKLRIQLGIEPSDYLTALISEAPIPAQLGRQATRSSTATSNLPNCDVRKEYRRISVLYTHLARRTSLGHEEWLHVSTSVVQRIQMLVTEYSGTLRQLSSSAILIYFGYPMANEHAAKWAVNVGLHIHKFIADEYNDLRVRSAVHSDVIITGSGCLLPDLIGECTTVVRTLAESAAFGTLLASGETMRGIFRFFELKESTGVSHQAFEVHSTREMSADHAYQQHISAFVGRDPQLRALNGVWKRAKLVGGASVLLIGGAGSGKSRLLRHFFSSSQIQRGDFCSLRFSPEHSSSPLYPVLALIKSYYVINKETTIEEIENKLTNTLAETGASDHYALQLLARLLSMQGGSSPKLSKSQRNCLFAVIVISLRGKIQQFTLISLVIEDVQWADALSLDFISWLRERSVYFRLFLVVTSRKRPQFLGHGSSTDTLIELPPLHPVQAATLALQNSQFRLARAPLQHRLLEMADGIPLFIERILEFSLESADQMQDFSCPPSLRDILMEQIDWLGDIRQILCHASCIGQKFTLPILASIESISLHRCRQLINKMIAAELVEELSEPDQFQFRFRLCREVAYSTLTHEEQQKIHLKIADFYSHGKEAISSCCPG